MIRKVVILVLLFTALGTGVAWVFVPSAPEGFLKYLTATRESKLHVVAYQGDAVLCYGDFPQRQSLPPVTIMVKCLIGVSCPCILLKRNPNRLCTAGG